MDTLVSTRIVGEDGLQGRIIDQIQSGDGTSQVVVAFDTGEQVRIPVAMLVLQADGSYFMPLKRESLHQGAHTGAENTLVLPVIAEELAVGKQTVETGRVRVRKVVRERDEVVDEPLLHEEIEVSRVAVNRQVDSPPEIRREGETLIVPVVEEVLVVEKRLIVKEELHITRRQTTVHEPQTVRLRSEDIIVEHLPVTDSREDTDRV